MIILGVETSCDETGACVEILQNDRVVLLSNLVASSQEIQSKWGGVVPEQASREQIKSIIPVIHEAMEQAKITPSQIDAIAVTQGPGLIGSLLVGVETAKTLSLIWHKPLIPINHLIAHFYANWIRSDDTLTELPKFPLIGLLVSGGHTDLILMKDHNNYEYLGGTRDDAAGECFDKSARLLNLPYPGGPNLSKLAESGDPSKFTLPKPMIDSGNLDFSFSGLKTAVLLASQSKDFKDRDKADLAAAVEASIIEVLVKKTLQAAKIHHVDHIMVAGGVAANHKLKAFFEKSIAEFLPREKLFIPPANLCTDNGAMITAAAFFQKPTSDPLSIQADPNLSLKIS